MGDIGVEELGQLGNLSSLQIDRRVNDLDERNWVSEMMGMTTLESYRQFKTEIKQENFYDNTWESALLFRLRSNSLSLGWRKRFVGESTVCMSCELGTEETLLHFLVHCSCYDDLRIAYNVGERTLPQILLFTEGCEAENVKKLIGKMWRRRENKRREGRVNEQGLMLQNAL